MGGRHRLASIAEDDLKDIAGYIAKDNPTRAVSFARELRARCATIAENPLAYPLREEFGVGVRLTVHGRYLILHAMRDRTLVIERILHGARHLGGLRL